MKQNLTSVDDYISEFPSTTAKQLKKLRSLILSTVPEAEESISYGMPAYKTFKKPLIYFGGYPKHIGFYATPTGHQAFTDELKGYKQGKGSVQFPIDQPLPIELIKRMLLFRKAENEKKYDSKP